MQTFLERSAEHIYSKHNHAQLSKVCIVLPSRRGVLYFKQAIAKLSDVPFLAPDVFAVEDFIMEMTGLRQIDQVALLFELFDVFKEIDPNVVFEKFMSWAGTLLSDFDKIDQYLVDPKALFSYISEAKALERWQMQLGESQKGNNMKTPRTDRYFKLFENIHTVYQKLRSRLTEKGLVYRGMAYRDLAENIDKYILEKDRHIKYYFVGFNALSDAEEKIIRTLLKRKNFAETIWDTDTYILKNTFQKAGDWLRHYKNGKEKEGIPPLYNEEWTWETNELLTGKKNIQIIGVPNASIQAKVAGHIYRGWNSEEEKNIENGQTAIVLGDENLLVPVMNSLDESVKDFNITMGLSLRNSMLFTLIDSLFELQRNLVEFKTEDGGMVKIPKFSHRQVVKVLNHPFLRRWELMKYQGEVQKPHPQPLSDGEGSILPQELEHKFFKKSTFEEWKILKPYARENRRESTETEEILWQSLRNRQLEGFKVRRQHSINLFIVDFVFLKQNLIIELDGEIHQINDHPKYDEYRTQELNELGFKVLRFNNEEILTNLDGVLRIISNYLENDNIKFDLETNYFPDAVGNISQQNKSSEIKSEEYPPFPSERRMEGIIPKSSEVKSEESPPSPSERGMERIISKSSEAKSEEYPPSPSERGMGGEVPIFNPIRKTLQEITDRNRVFLSSKDLAEISENDPMFEVLFKHWNNKPQNAIKCFYELIDLLRDVYKENQDAIETEYLFQFYLILQRMDGILENRKDAVAMRSFKMFLYEFIKQTKIPFESETNESLQIMGMLETRTLDFEKLIILSVNEGTLPLTNRQHTLIPFDALTDPQFNLPTHNHADSIMAYHFFRLLQRAKEVILVHVLPSDTYGAGEKSRFILQIEHELAKANPNITLTYPTVKFVEGENKLHDETRLEIHKTEDILQFMEKSISEKGIYPSHFNQYVQCSLQYYFSKIAGIAEAEEVEEKIGVDTFGNWIHKTFENIDKEFVENGGVVEKEDLENVLSNIDSYLKQAFKETNMGLRAEEGMNFILYQVGETIVKKFINYQLKNEIFPFELLDVEKTLKVEFKVNVNNKTIPVNIAGRIDRMDRIGGNHVRVIDYKTGKVEAKDLKISIEDLDADLLGNKDKDKFRQLWLYKYMVLKQMVSVKGLTIGGRKLEETENTVTAGIYSFRNIDEGLLQQDIAFHEGETIQDFIYQSEQYLQTFVQDLMNPEKPFEKRKDHENCGYCDYRRICGR